MRKADRSIKPEFHRTFIQRDWFSKRCSKIYSNITFLCPSVRQNTIASHNHIHASGKGWSVALKLAKVMKITNLRLL